MARVVTKINRRTVKKIHDLLEKEAVERTKVLRDKVYDTLYSLSSAVLPFENEYGVAVKTGAFRRSITPTQTVRVSKGVYEAEVFFDQNIAPHAIFVIEGTEKMPARPIHIIALELVRMQLK